MTNVAVMFWYKEEAHTVVAYKLEAEGDKIKVWLHGKPLYEAPEHTFELNNILNPTGLVKYDWKEFGDEYCRSDHHWESHYSIEDCLDFINIEAWAAGYAYLLIDKDDIIKIVDVGQI